MSTSQQGRALRVVEKIRRAFVEFLTIPTVVIGVFLALAVSTYFLDQLRIAQEWPVIFPGDHDSARDFLATIAAGIITVTSITFSLLLVAVQQGAASLTSEVYDQFLRRRANQTYFGFFVGLALYCLVILATIQPDYTPRYGVALAFLLTVAALYMLILLIYTTIDQSRPVMVIKAIRDHTLLARDAQLSLLRATRRQPRLERFETTGVRADQSGFLTRIDIGRVKKAAEGMPGPLEIVIMKSIGDYVAFRDIMAEIRTGGGDVSDMEDVVRSALSLEMQRDLDTDPAHGIEQLETIGWTSVSTAKSNPQPGLLACLSLRDILARWYDSDESAEGEETPEPSCVVYFDNVAEKLMQAFESLAVVASESMQHQTIAEIYGTFAVMLPRLPLPLQQRVEILLLRSLSALGDHVSTGKLHDALSAAADALHKVGRVQAAAAVVAAQEELEAKIGLLNARSTRATP